MRIAGSRYSDHLSARILAEVLPTFCVLWILSALQHARNVGNVQEASAALGGGLQQAAFPETALAAVWAPFPRSNSDMILNSHLIIRLQGWLFEQRWAW